MQERQKIDLSGEWRFAMDPLETGINKSGGWYEQYLPGTIKLPGTTASNQIGIPPQLRDRDNTGTGYMYIGAAWYQRDLDIPETWADKRVELSIERTAHTMVWVDDVHVGGLDDTQAPQVIDLGEAAFPGTHTITVRVNNSSCRPLQYGRRKINGMEGGISLTAMDKVYIKKIQVRSDISRHRAAITATVGNDTGLPAKGMMSFSIAHSGGKHSLPEKRVEFLCEGAEKSIFFEFYLGEDMLLWDEFEPNLYDMTVSLEACTRRRAYTDLTHERFGMRNFSREGMQFCSNGHKVFLRGNMCGRPSLFDEDEREYWRRIMKKHREWGINHLRFHSNVPNQYVFDAADEFGVYLQIELSLWAWVCFPHEFEFEPMLEETLKQRGDRILEAYGNHPSFVMMALGNENSGDYNMLGRVVAHLRKTDPTRLYAQGSNNNLMDPFHLEGDDFFVSCKSHAKHLHIRGSSAHGDGPVGPVQQDDPPDTLRSFAESLHGYSVPMIGHEVGQYESSPNFDDLDLFPPGKAPVNLQLFRELAEKKGLLEKEKAFFNASKYLSGLCYREDLELHYRTPGMAGFQILAMNDVLGEGSSIVGVWNKLGDSKGMFSPEEWKRFCNDRVLLCRYAKYVWNDGEEFSAHVQISNYGPKDIAGAHIIWKLLDGEKALTSGELGPSDAPQGELSDLGLVRAKLNTGKNAKIILRIEMPEQGLVNEYPLWVFTEEKLEKTSVRVVSALDKEAVEALKQGERVVFFAQNIPSKYAVEGFFAANFWSYAMFSRISLSKGFPVMPGTLGILLDPKHPVFSRFPSQSSSDWQWWRLVMHSTAIVMDDLPKEMQPILQVIDNPMRCLKLGSILEMKVGSGKLLVAAIYILPLLEKYGEARALYNGIVNYAASADFAPQVELSVEKALDHFVI